MSNAKATKPVTIDADLYNELVDHLEGEVIVPAKLLHRLEAVILIDDDCIDGDGSELCETHNYLPMEYYLDIKGKLLKRGSFDPEDTGFPVCPDSQKYDEKLATKYARGR